MVSLPCCLFKLLTGDVALHRARLAPAGGVRIPHIPAWGLPRWNAAVVLDVRGAGIGRLLAALRRGDRLAA